MGYKIGDKLLATLYRKRFEVEIVGKTDTNEFWVKTPFGKELWEEKDFKETESELKKNN